MPGTRGSSYYCHEAIFPFGQLWHFLLENQDQLLVTLLNLGNIPLWLRRRCGTSELSHEIKNANPSAHGQTRSSWASAQPDPWNKEKAGQGWMIHVQTPSLIHNKGGNHPVVPRSLQSQPHLAEIRGRWRGEGERGCASSFQAQSLAASWMLGDDQIGEEYSWAAGLTTHGGTVGN